MLDETTFFCLNFLCKELNSAFEFSYWSVGWEQVVLQGEAGFGVC